MPALVVCRVLINPLLTRCLQLDQNASQQTVEHTLTKLLRYLQRTKRAIEPGGAYGAFGGLGEEERRISSNLQDLVRTTQSFHSTTSTSVGGQTVIRQDSVMGNPLNREEEQRINEYIATIYEHDEDGNQSCKIKEPSYQRSTNTFLQRRRHHPK